MDNTREDIISMWLSWHFYEMPKFLALAWKNYLLFILNYFSIIFLLKTLFSPWRKYKWYYPKAFDIQEFFSTLISNIFSRFLGALCRIVLIIVGSVAQFITFVIGPVVILAWLLIPVIIVLGIIFIIV